MGLACRRAIPLRVLGGTGLAGLGREWNMIRTVAGSPVITWLTHLRLSTYLVSTRKRSRRRPTRSLHRGHPGGNGRRLMRQQNASPVRTSSLFLSRDAALGQTVFRDSAPTAVTCASPPALHETRSTHSSPTGSTTFDANPGGACVGREFRSTTARTNSSPPIPPAGRPLGSRSIGTRRRRTLCESESPTWWVSGRQSGGAEESRQRFGDQGHH
jgi:hypothetical protein